MRKAYQRYDVMPSKYEMWKHDPKTIYGAAFSSREANFQIDKEEISTNTAGKVLKHLNVVMKKKAKIFFARTTH